MDIRTSLFITTVCVILVQQLNHVECASSNQSHSKKNPAISGATQNSQPSQISEQQASNAQYVHDKEFQQNIAEEDYSDSYQVVNDYKTENLGHMQYMPLNPFSTPMQAMPPSPPPSVPYQVYPFDQLASMPSPRLLPIFGYAQTVLVPFYIPSELLFTNLPEAQSNLGNYEDVAMSRAANGRRPISMNSGLQRNSPIYYVRLPPTPYMFLPNVGIPSVNSGPNLNTGYSPFISLQSVPTISPLSTIYNIPVNFLANGKPSGIYQIGGSPNDLQNPLNFGSPIRPSIPSTNPYRPSQHNPLFGSHQPFGSMAPPNRNQDSKLTLLKRPFIFNGRPEDIFILPNNLNPTFNDNSYY